MKLCQYGCGQEAKYQFKNGKLCCSKHWKLCPVKRERHSKLMKDVWKNPKYKSKMSKPLREGQRTPDMRELHSKLSKAMWKNPTYRKNRIKERTYTIEHITYLYPTFAKEEEMRYDPDLYPEKLKIQVHCKYNKCPNSKEKGGWFTLPYVKIYERIRQLEHQGGNGGAYLYC